MFALIFYSDIPETKEPIPKEVTATLKGTFTYLGEGSQSIAYVSEDGTMALKLFKASHQKSFKIKRLFQRKDKEQSSQKWKLKFEETARRTKLAYTYLKEESALIYLHFEATEEPLRVTLKERSGTLRKISLNQLPFALQKKAILAPDYLLSLIANGDLEKARLALAKLKLLFETRAKKGFSDPRQTLSTNYGFVDGSAIQIDVGKIERDPDVECATVQAKVDDWARKNFPSLF